MIRQKFRQKFLKSAKNIIFGETKGVFGNKKNVFGIILLIFGIFLPNSEDHISPKTGFCKNTMWSQNSFFPYADFNFSSSPSPLPHPLPHFDPLLPPLPAIFPRKKAGKIHPEAISKILPKTLKISPSSPLQSQKKIPKPFPKLSGFPPPPPSSTIPEKKKEEDTRKHCISRLL